MDHLDLDLEENDFADFVLDADADAKMVTELLQLSVSESKDEFQTSLNGLVSFARQLGRTDIRLCQPHDVEILNPEKPVGMGATLTVFKGTLKPHGRAVAIKRLNIERPVGESRLEIYEKEYRSMLGSMVLELRVMAHPWFLSHPNIVDLIAVYWESIEGGPLQPGKILPVMVVELADESYPTLQALIEGDALGLGETERFQLLENVAEGMTIIHSASMIHGDLKPQNILLFRKYDKYIAKVSDFGYSKPYVEGEGSIGGTAYWNAPECLDESLPQYKPYANTLTRDIYSYGLLMWFTLFCEMPFGPSEEASSAEIALQKLTEGKGGISWRLEQKLDCVKAEPDTFNFDNEILDDHAQESLLWWQVWKAMSETFRVNPKSRNIALGEMRSVYTRPARLIDRFIPDVSKRKDPSYIRQVHRVDENERSRPYAIAAIVEDEPATLYGGFSGFNLGNLPLEAQKVIFSGTEHRLNLISSDEKEYPDLLMVLASYHRLGFGVEKQLATATQLELRAAICGSRAGQYAMLTNHFLAGVELAITAELKVSWLLAALTLDAFHSRKVEQRAAATRAEALLRAIPILQLESCLIDGFKQMHLREFEIKSGLFDDMMEDGIFKYVVHGDTASLRRMLIEDPKLLKAKMNGFGLIHIAADSCQDGVILVLVSEFRVSCDEESEDGATPLEIAACTGSLECCRQLVALGSSPRSALSQDLFNSVALMGCRGRKNSESSGGPGRIRELLRLLCENSKLALDMADKTTMQTSSTPDTIMQDLVDGKFQYETVSPDGRSQSNVSGNEQDLHSTPLQYALTITHYDSVLALLGLGADPNIFLHDHPPLHLAVLAQSPILVAILLANGADPNICESAAYNLMMPLHVANCFQDVTFSLPPRLHISDFGETAAEGQRQEQGLESERSDQDEIYDLEVVKYGMERSKPDCVRGIIYLLREAGADINALDAEEKTPLQLALEMEDKVAIEALRSLGAVEP